MENTGRTISLRTRSLRLDGATMCREMFMRGCIARRSAILSSPLNTAIVCSIFEGVIDFNKPASVKK